MKYTAREIEERSRQEAAKELLTAMHWTWKLVQDYGLLSIRAWDLYRNTSNDERKERANGLYTWFRSRETSAYQCHNDLARTLNRIYDMQR